MSQLPYLICYVSVCLCIALLLSHHTHKDHSELCPETFSRSGLDHINRIYRSLLTVNTQSLISVTSGIWLCAFPPLSALFSACVISHVTLAFLAVSIRIALIH